MVILQKAGDNMTDSEKLDLILSEMQTMKSDMDTMKSDMDTMKKDIQETKQKVTGIELHLENVTDRNIQIVAEGHLNLSRKLDNALKVENEKEMLIIKVNILEDELRKLKEKINKIA